MLREELSKARTANKTHAERVKCKLLDSELSQLKLKIVNFKII
jgi:hypothetical protein